MTPWEHEERVWEEDGYYITPITTQADLSQEGKLQGHCAGAHLRFIEAKVTYLFSLRDKDGVPKATIHFKPTELINVPQPMDKEENVNPTNSYRWLKSTSYDYSGGSRDYPEFVWEGRPCKILSVSGRGVWGNEGKGVTYRGIVKNWVQSLATTREATAAPAAA